MYDRTLEARAYFRRGKFRLNETQKAEMAYRYNSYGNYRKSLMGKLNLVNSGGSYLDSVWGEICELFPEYSRRTRARATSRKSSRSSWTWRMRRPEVNPYEQFHGMEDAAAALADELVETVENIGRRPAPERYLEDGRDAGSLGGVLVGGERRREGAAGLCSGRRPGASACAGAWELYDNGMTPASTGGRAGKRPGQASELRLFDDGRPAADTF